MASERPAIAGPSRPRRPLLKPAAVVLGTGTMPHTTIDGVKIHYDEAGEGEPLLLIMGYGMPGDAWLGSVPFLRDFRCIYYDNRGTGRSDRPAGPYTIVRMADDAAGLLDHLGIARAHVYGVSMGGMIAQELVLRHPAKVRSLVLGCTLCGGEHSTMADPEILETLIDVVASMGRGDPAAWVDRQLPLLFAPDWIAANPGIRDLFLMMAPMLPPTPPETAHLAMAGLFGWTTHDRLPAITAPTLIVHGDRDVLIPVENAHVLARRIPSARLHIIPGAGHGYPAQDPVGVHQLVTDFLRAS